MYHIHLQNFDGPMDLLLYFIRRDEIDIYDIPIAKITKEYIQTLDEMRAMNISLAGDFVEMAATLMRIKSRMLLPSRKDIEENDIEDPRTTLVHQLIDYQRFKELAKILDDLSTNRSQFIRRGLITNIPLGEEDPSVYLREVSLYDIALIFKQAMENKPVIQYFELQRERVSLDHQKAFLLVHFDREGYVEFADLLSQIETKIEMIVTFLALLELIRSGLVRVLQGKLFGEIKIQLLETRVNN
jgi:segregation and condensation protein A